MKYRKLRIAWSVAWGVVAVLLVALWARSHWRIDSYCLEPEGRHYRWTFESAAGRIGVQHIEITLGEGSYYFTDSDSDDEGQQEVETAFYKVGEDGYLYRPALTSAGFGVGLNRLGYGLLLPHWFLTLLAASVGAIPWLPWNFSLRTLLIATTLVAVGLGLIYCLAR